MKKIYSLLIMFSFILSGCARDLASDTYVDSSTVSLTLEGTVLSMRQVTIKEGDKASDNVAGTAVGGIAGAVVGSTLGKGAGNTLATLGGALGGAVAGNLIQGKMSTQKGFEYIIKVNKQDIKDNYRSHSAAMSRVLSAAATSGLITIVQGKDVVLSAGQPVYVIFSDDRARVIAR